MKQTVAVTGASSGIGLATALAYARQGANVALLARGEDGLADAANAVAEAGGTPLALSVDVTDPAALEAAADRIERELGPIEVWVGAAVAAGYGHLLELSDDDVRRVVEVTLLGQFFGVRTALRRMIPRDRGSVVMIGSALGYRGFPLQAPYSASKFGLRGLLDSVRAELSHQGSRVDLSLVAPASVDTPFYRAAMSRLARRPSPAGPVYSPEAVAEAVLFCARTGRREMTVGSIAALAKQTQNLAPALTDRLVGAWAENAQQRDETNDPTDDGDLRTPSRAPALRGGFGGRPSLQTWASRHRSALWGAAAVIGALALVRKRA